MGGGVCGLGSQGWTPESKVNKSSLAFVSLVILLVHKPFRLAPIGLWLRGIVYGAHLLYHVLLQGAVLLAG